MTPKRVFRWPLFAVLFAVIGVWILSSTLFSSGPENIDTSVGLKLLSGKTVDQAKIVDGAQRVDLSLTRPYKDKGDLVRFYYVGPQGADVVEAIEKAKLPGGYNSEVPSQSWLSSLAITVIPFIVILAVFWFLMSQMQGSRGGGFGRSRAKLVSPQTPQGPRVTFADVAGVDEAVQELQEIKAFLSEPGKFYEVGAKIPKGVLLVGPPGTGKTLLARAVAGEAEVPFFTISGSDFVEMFVGVGASRVRDMFEQAKSQAPAIIFIDEIDAVGRHRGAGLGGGHDEREQTLNQLLVEMDGFEGRTNVIMIAATNRPDILDPALLRPGRFDRQVTVNTPDLRGRRAILAVHAKGKPMDDEVDLDLVARRTPGFSGADLANVLNEAALLTARSANKRIDNRALDEAIDRVVAGPQRSTLMSDADKRFTAYHEGGHAVVAAALRNTDPVTKVTILPRGRALGYTMVMPTKDKHTVTRNEMLDSLAYSMGGRAAEEIVFHDPTSGASNDIEKATGIARTMVMSYGMSENLGSVAYSKGDGEVFLGRDYGHRREYSEEIAAAIDEEVRRLIERAHDEAWEILQANRHVLDKVVVELLEHETLDEAALAAIFVDIVKREPREVWLSSKDRPVSDAPPVPLREENGQQGPAGGG
ncbi:MAG: ATP-dependent zinc metalloprotease FtsH [Bifidobacteriaceae bacterium]|jgi:cell division protease FtsH|nr:ATP-dependent zinc metalloprotease FtsH [Bifidobacteriaceae bacterium]